METAPESSTELTMSVLQVCRQLPPEDQEKVAIFTSNYGEAAAISYYGRKYGVSEPISGHNNYWLWGPGEWSGEVLIAVNVREEFLERFYLSVDQVASTSCNLCVDYENNAPIVVARGAKVPLADFWPQMKHYE